MHIGFKPALMLGLVFTMAPSPIDAAPPAPNRARIFPSVHVYRSKVKGVTVAARLDAKSKGDLAVKLELHNPSKRSVTTRLRVDVYERRPSSRMARMVPPPIHHGSKVIKVTLGAGKKLAKRLVIKKGKLKAADAPRYYTIVRKAPKRAKRTKARRASRWSQQARRAG
jgi:hypothetical protein